MRGEEEVEISKMIFQAIWSLTESARISKTRYRIRFSGRTIELDVYHGPHRGLITAEVEFDSPREGNRFVPPRWFGREITGNNRYANQTLARRVNSP